MGDWFQTIADVEATPDEADPLATVVMDWLVASGVVTAASTDCVLDEGLGHAPGSRYAEVVVAPDPALHALSVNGALAIRGRKVFDAGQGGVDHVSCPHCGAEAEWDGLSGAIGAWYEGGNGVHRCTGCLRTVGLNDWRWEPPWGFGHLGFTFWNWPTLRPEFVAEVSARLGHRVVCIAGKL